LIVERTDFISVPVTDMERAKRFYGETLGLPEIAHPEQGFPEYQLGENVSLYLLQMENIGQTFEGPHTFEFDESPFDTGVCHMAIFKDPDGNQLMLHRRYVPHES
jgi:catechol 2,3-dioxygenase-like lactoylglutathione lyase family enzyme